jgi:hypothetical protein
VYQDVVYIEPVHSIMEGYGKGGKLKRAFHFPTTPATATATGLNLLTLGVSGAKAPIRRLAFIGTDKSVPFQNTGSRCKQRVETS